MSAIHLSDATKFSLSKKALPADDYTKFRSNFISYIEKIKTASQNNENEEHIKNIMNDFLRMNFYSEARFSINTDGNIDSAIKENGELLVIIETKTPYNKSEMIYEGNLNRKALHEVVYYYLERAVDTSKSKAMISIKCQIRHLIVTDAINVLCQKDFPHAFTVPKRVSADECHAFGNGQTVNLRTVQATNDRRFELVVDHAVFHDIVRRIAGQTEFGATRKGIVLKADH